MRDVLQRVVDALRPWDGTHPAPTDAVRAAREGLARIGVPDPSCGWDAWDGKSDAWTQQR